MEKDAHFSPCRTWRYTLYRVWDEDRPLTAFIGLNPSTADETEDDPTIRRCINFAQDWGYGGIIMLNLFAYRATDPTVMKAAPDPVGPDNDAAIDLTCSEAGIVIACWGVHGEFVSRGDQVASRLKNLHCLGTTKDGYPKHPLYLKKDLKPIPYA